MTGIGTPCTTTSTDLSIVSTARPPALQGSASSAVTPGRVRNTRQAGVIEAALREADGFRTAQQLFAWLRERGESIGLTTVYRYLNLLAGQDRADVVRSADGEAQYRLCGPADDSGGRGGADDREHHHHVVCRVCGRSVEVSGPEVETWARQVATAAGYTDISHTVEVFGLCPEHSAPAAKTRRPARRPRSTPS